MTIKRWELRINDLDASKGVSNKMIQACMKAEIADLRKEMAALQHAWEKAMRAQHKAMSTQIKRQAALTQQAKERAATWKKHADRYQRMAAERFNK